ncbi:hypothetical protein [Vulcanisaeta souniana]|uniref:Homing endonuclease LAGLIDADG domain-containing protein n=1 Tax=Vulcanisaeta souniana JCM 11219 TaxID=1293586 RepID=A0A830E3I9_9CREN|nr:hypothetical protein [Vulcanisaeta souniana]GGI67306.1 hypothetical protein GCM10007112_00350 [Vulcanisaeta souniana JCM 11219]
MLSLDDEEFTTFLLFFTLGDGSIDVKKQRIRLYIYKRELKQLIDRLRNYGFIEERWTISTL